MAAKSRVAASRTVAPTHPRPVWSIACSLPALQLRLTGQEKPKDA
jgi:hypothetical protein